MTKELYTANYGLVTVIDVMVDPDGTNLAEGINIRNKNGKLLAEIVGVSSDDVTNGDDAEMHIDNYNED